jgi:hypothetical protein
MLQDKLKTLNKEYEKSKKDNFAVLKSLQSSSIEDFRTKSNMYDLKTAYKECEQISFELTEIQKQLTRLDENPPWYVNPFFFLILLLIQ